MLRLGDPATERPVDGVSPGTALPLFIDYVRLRPSVSVVNTIALPSVSGDGGAACTLAAGSDPSRWDFEEEGFPSNSVDMRLGLIPCYNVSEGGNIGSESQKTIALVDSSGQVDSSISGLLGTGSANGNGGWRQLASADGTSFYTASTASQAGGFRYISNPRALDAQGRFVSTRILSSNFAAGNKDARAVVLYAGKLFAMAGPSDAPFDTLTQLGAGTAPTASTGAFTRLAGIGSLGSAWSFCWGATWTDVFVSVDRPVFRGMVQLWRRSTAAGAAFSRVFTIEFSKGSPVRSITGRSEFGRFVLYGTTRSRLYRYDTSGIALRTTQATVVHTAAPGTQLRGVFFGGLPAETQTPSPTRSPSRTRTATKTQSRSPTASKSLQSRSRSRSQTKKPRKL